MSSIADFVKDNMVFSFSSVSSFETCAYSFKLNYIDAEERVGNWYGDYGLLIHKTLEEYFRGNLKREWLKDYFISNYSSVVVSDPPSYPDGIEEKYREDSLNFFDLYDLPDLDDYEIVSIEDVIEAEYEGIKLVVKPDLVLREKATGKTILMDYKSSKPQIRGKWDLKKIEGYENQLVLYAYFLEKERGIHIDKISLLFVRLMQSYDIEINQEKTEKVLNWFSGAVQRIKWEEDFEPKVNQFFCSQLCSVRNSCKFWR